MPATDKLIGACYQSFVDTIRWYRYLFNSPSTIPMFAFFCKGVSILCFWSPASLYSVIINRSMILCCTVKIIVKRLWGLSLWVIESSWFNVNLLHLTSHFNKGRKLRINDHFHIDNTTKTIVLYVCRINWFDTWINTIYAVEEMIIIITTLDGYIIISGQLWSCKAEAYFTHILLVMFTTHWVRLLRKPGYKSITVKPLLYNSAKNILVSNTVWLD